MRVPRWRALALLIALAAGSAGAAAAPTVPATTAGGFTNAARPWRLVFPRDHAAHFGFRSEWWYYTGHLWTGDGRRWDYELTFFRLGLRPGRARPARGQSRWRGSQVYAAHFALIDERGGRFRYVERYAREALGAGGASDRRLDVHVGDWTLSGPAPFRLSAHDGATALDLVETAQKPPAVHGADGVSRKADCATCASHYYSLTRLRTVGTLTEGGRRQSVVGLSWMDHEFGSAELQPNQAGWDWFSLQLADRRELMLYRLRQKDGSVTPQSSGSLVTPDGRVTHLTLEQFSTTATGTWTSPHTHGVYPSGWRVQVPRAALDLDLIPVVADAELADTTSVSYWEGAVDVRDHASGRSLGVGYVELTGYAGAVSL